MPINYEIGDDVKRYGDCSEATMTSLCMSSGASFRANWINGDASCSCY